MLKGLKSALFEDEPEAEKSGMIQPSEPWPTPPPGASVLNQFNAMMTALEATLPDRALRIKVAITTLTTQGITKDQILQAIDGEKRSLQASQNIVKQGFADRTVEINKMTTEYNDLLVKAEEIRKESFSLTEKLNGDIEQSSTTFYTELTKLDDLTKELKDA